MSLRVSRRRCTGRRSRSRIDSGRRSLGLPNRIDQTGVGGFLVFGLGLDPLRFTEEVFERRGQRRIIYSQCNDLPLLGGSTLDLFADVRGADGVFRQDEYQSLGTTDCSNNRIGI